MLSNANCTLPCLKEGPFRLLKDRCEVSCTMTTCIPCKPLPLWLWAGWQDELRPSVIWGKPTWRTRGSGKPRFKSVQKRIRSQGSWCQTHTPSLSLCSTHPAYFQFLENGRREHYYTICSFWKKEKTFTNKSKWNIMLSVVHSLYIQVWHWDHLCTSWT